MESRVFDIKGALLYFEDGTRKRTEFQARTSDLENIREAIKNTHNAKVVRLEYEEAI